MDIVEVQVEKAEATVVVEVVDQEKVVVDHFFLGRLADHSVEIDLLDPVDLVVIDLQEKVDSVVDPLIEGLDLHLIEEAADLEKVVEIDHPFPLVIENSLQVIEEVSVEMVVTETEGREEIELQKKEM